MPFHLSLFFFFASSGPGLPGVEPPLAGPDGRPHPHRAAAGGGAAGRRQRPHPRPHPQPFREHGLGQLPGGGEAGTFRHGEEQLITDQDHSSPHLVQG